MMTLSLVDVAGPNDARSVQNPVQCAVRGSPLICLTVDADRYPISTHAMYSQVCIRVERATTKNRQFHRKL